jgi:hypothetical protein
LTLPLFLQAAGIRLHRVLANSSVSMAIYAHPHASVRTEDIMRVIHKIINYTLIKLWPAATSCVTLDDHDRE